jgi:hypothetical protein
MAPNLETWTREQLIETVRVLRRENATLQREISRFLSGHAQMVPRPGEHPNRLRRLDLTKRCR